MLRQKLMWSYHFYIILLISYLSIIWIKGMWHCLNCLICCKQLKISSRNKSLLSYWQRNLIILLISRARTSRENGLSPPIKVRVTKWIKALRKRKQKDNVSIVLNLVLRWETTAITNFSEEWQTFRRYVYYAHYWNKFNGCSF